MVVNSTFEAAILRARTVLATTLIDSATVTRTGKTYDCRLAEGRQRQVNMDGLPDYMRGRLWKFTLPYNADVIPGDVLTVAGKGTFNVTGDASASSINVAKKVFAFHSGSPEMYHIPTHQVQFRQQGSQLKTTLSWVTIVPIDTTLKPQRTDWVFTHEVTWPLALQYSNNQPIGRGDAILLAELTNGYAELDYVRRYPAVGICMANFRDQ